MTLDREQWARIETRRFRQQFELSDNPATHEFESAGARMGWRNRADVPESARAYFHRKQCLTAAAIRARNPGAIVTLHGREFRGHA